MLCYKNILVYCSYNSGGYSPYNVAWSLLFQLPWLHICRGGGGEGYSRSQVMGMLQGFEIWMGLKFLTLGFFWVGKFGKYFLGGFI